MLIRSVRVGFHASTQSTATLGSIYLVSIRENDSKISEEISDAQEILESTNETVEIEQN